MSHKRELREHSEEPRVADPEKEVDEIHALQVRQVCSEQERKDVREPQSLIRLGDVNGVRLREAFTDAMACTSGIRQSNECPATEDVDGLVQEVDGVLMPRAAYEETREQGPSVSTCARDDFVHQLEWKPAGKP